MDCGTYNLCYTRHTKSWDYSVLNVPITDGEERVGKAGVNTSPKDETSFKIADCGFKSLLCQDFVIPVRFGINDHLLFKSVTFGSKKTILICFIRHALAQIWNKILMTIKNQYQIFVGCFSYIGFF